MSSVALRPPLRRPLAGRTVVTRRRTGGQFALVLLAILHAFVGDRLYLEVGTEGRGLLSATSVVVPAIAWLYLCLCARGVIAGLITRREFWRCGALLAVVLMLLPVGGILFYEYPARATFAGIEGVLALTALLVGYAYRRSHADAARTIAVVVALFCGGQLLIALTQSTSLDVSLLGIRDLVGEWDSIVRAAYGREQVVAGRSIGTFINPNTLGLAAVLAAIWSAYSLKGHSKALAIAIAIGVVFFSQSRAALLALVLSTGAAFVLNGKRRIPTGVSAIVVGAFLILLAIGVPNSVYDELARLPVFESWLVRTGSGARALSGSITADENVEARIVAWKEAVEFSGSYPLGTLGPPQLLFGRSIDNDLLRLWCQGGLPLLALFLGSMGAVIRLRASEPEIRLARHATVAMLVAGASGVMLTTTAAVLWWLTVGVAIGSVPPRVPLAGPVRRFQV